MSAIYTKAQRVAIGQEFFNTTTAAAEKKVLAKYGSTIVRRGLTALATVLERDGDAKGAETALGYREDIPTHPGQEGYVERPTKPVMPAGVEVKATKATTKTTAKSKAPAKGKAKSTKAKASTGRKQAVKKPAAKKSTKAAA